MIRVLIADDHHLFRDGLAHVLNDHAEMSVVAGASDGLQALALALELRPDLVLVDLSMPGLDGLALIRRLRQELPGAVPVVLTMSNQADDLLAALQAGARGYLLKSVTSQALTEALSEIHLGRIVISPEMLPALVEAYLRMAALLGQPDPKLAQLSGRERQVLQAVALGQTNPQIGAALGLSPHTVKAHLRSIMDKLGFHTRAEAAAWGARHIERSAPD